MDDAGEFLCHNISLSQGVFFPFGDFCQGIANVDFIKKL